MNFGRHAIYIHAVVPFDPETAAKYQEALLNPRHEYYYTADGQRKVRIMWDGRPEREAAAFPLTGSWSSRNWPWPGTPEWPEIDTNQSADEGNI